MPFLKRCWTSVHHNRCSRCGRSSIVSEVRRLATLQDLVVVQLKVCLDDPEVTQLLFMAAKDMARSIGGEPEFLAGHNDSHLKTRRSIPGDRNRHSFQGCQFGAEVEKACAPFPHFSSLSRPELGRTAWDMPFGPSPMHTHVPPFCQLTE